MSENNEATPQGTPKGEDISVEEAYRVLNTFKEDKRVDTKELVKKYGRTTAWWSGRKGSMTTSDKPFQDLKRMGFSNAEIAPWVKRPTVGDKVPDPQQKTGSPAGDGAEIQRKQQPIGNGFTSPRNQPLTLPSPESGSESLRVRCEVLGVRSRRGYKGYRVAQLEGMGADQLQALVRSYDDEIYIYTQGERARS